MQLQKICLLEEVLRVLQFWDWCGPHCKCEGCKNPHPKPDDAESPTSNLEVESQISTSIAKDLGLGLKNEALSDKSNLFNLGLDILNLQRTKSLPVFGRDLTSYASGQMSTLPFFGFENRL